MSRRWFLAIAALILPNALVAIPMRVETTRYPVFVGDVNCACIRTKKETKTVTASEITLGKSIYQVFKPLNGGREIFRVPMGIVVDSEAVKFWNYGIADEADFNGDGVQDYSWYGGDDSSSAMYLFLSRKGTYEQVDILKTLKFAWTNRFHEKAPSLENVADDYDIKEVVLERTDAKLTMSATIEQIPETVEDLKKKLEPISLRIDQSGFKQ